MMILGISFREFGVKFFGVDLDASFIHIFKSQQPQAFKHYGYFHIDIFLQLRNLDGNVVIM